MAKNTQKKVKADSIGASFTKIMFASSLGFVVATVLISILSIIFIIAFAAGASSKTEVQENTVLVIKLNQPIVEQQQGDLDFNIDFMGLANPSSLGLNKIIKAIDKAKNDENIKGIYLNLSVITASLAELKEIKDALEDFKTSGKFIIAHADNYIASTYYLATVADKIYITPTGTMIWKGFSSQIMFYKGLFDKLDIEPVIIRHGKFKSAVEPYMLDSMSPANRLQLQTLIDNMWDNYVDEIADARNLDVTALNLYADSLMINSSEKAVTLGLIDKEMFKLDVIDEIKNLTGIDIDKKLKTISLKNYIDVDVDATDISKAKTKDKIAIVYAEGQIIDGKSNDNSMGSITISNAIRKAASDSSVKAIVLRINSPGGSALASEVILHEIELAKKHKPIVVSMGRYAASGGYYIACYADKIYAEPYTITGSIGVFGLMFNLEKLLNNKLGINIEVVKSNANADFGNMTRAMSPQEKQFLQFQIEDIYDKFISHVAIGRNLTKDYVDSIGQGRVWAADDALDIGLIDEIGSIQSAIDEAASLANLDKYKIVEYPKVVDFFEKFIQNYQTKSLQKELGSYYDIYEDIQNLQNMQGIQMRMLWDIDVN